MNFSPLPPHVFAGENYNIWAVKMKIYLQVHNLWSVVQVDIEPPSLRANATIAQIRIMATINNIRLLGDEFSDKKIVEKSKEEKIEWRSILRELFKPEAERVQARAQVTRNQAQTVEDVQAQEEYVFTASCFTSSSKARKNWLIDSGCTHHMAFNKVMFKELDTSSVSKVRIGNCEFIEAKSKGKAVICTQSGNKTISEVLFVPDIDQNLLGVGQLLEKGYSLIFENKTCVIKDPSDQVLVAVAMHDRYFILDVNRLEAKAHIALVDESCLWHKRLGYVNYKSLSLLHKLSLVKDMSKIEPRKDVCEVCQYFALFIDDCTRFYWVSFLKQNSDVTDFFFKFKALVENQASCKLKTLRSDNGITCVSQRFQKICDEVGIQHQLTTIYTPQQNGVFETEDDFVSAPVRGTKTLIDIYKMCDITIVEPFCFDDATREGCWKEAMEAELMMIYKNDTWELVDRPINRRVIGVKWLDVKSAFLNGFLKEEIFVEQPDGFKVLSEDDKVYKLKNAMYSLKHAPRAWYDRIDAYLSRLGFEKSISELKLYVNKAVKRTFLIVSLYVDGLLVTGCRSEMIEEFKNRQAFPLKVLSIFYIANRKPASTSVALGEKLSSNNDHDRVDKKSYKSLICCLLYLIAIKPDIMFVVSLLSRFMHCCNVTHFKAAKRVLRYVKGTLSYGVKFERAEELKPVGYSDSDWASSVDDMKSTSGYFLTLGLGVFSWSFMKQQTVAQSIVEAEYIATATAVNQAIWLRKLLSDLNADQMEAIEIRVDN
ncbi:pleiotropic drug resistance protein 3-like [Gossypium australe]|uniref:Pleiotropic drug resistance protein 3-like n=1 Tax=Gossypium australe TaxID=47621 RepID=A0A5B6VVL3_9ROSI|nr:pleiotropic drug resistance protein 3-like [Gossypium australe]